jgi:hypothetical protein
MRLVSVLVVVVMILGACKRRDRTDAATTDSRGGQSITKPVKDINPTQQQIERRKRSEVICLSKGVPVYKNSNSLFVDSDTSVTIRTKDEVVDRALALCYIGLKSEGLEQKFLDKMDKDYNVSSKLSLDEKLYATSKAPTQQQKVDANWRYESLHVMLWALGFIDSLRYPDQMCDVASDVKIIHDLTEGQFRSKAKLRTKSEILDQADLILRLNWACVSARIANETAPGELDASVVYERHYSLNWLIRHLDQEWDKVTTDT